MDDGVLSYSSREGGDGIVVLKLVGPLTLRNMFAFQSELASNKPPLMVFDLQEVPYMDSAGIGVLINYYVAAQKNGRKMVLAGANERIDALLVLTKVQELLRNFPTVEDAIAQA